jgi:hypothetical protein
MKVLVDAFKEYFQHLTIDSVWLIQKSKQDARFQGWHRDFALGKKMTTTIVVNVGAIGKN